MVLLVGLLGLDMATWEKRQKVGGLCCITERRQYVTVARCLAAVCLAILCSAAAGSQMMECRGVFVGSYGSSSAIET